MNMDMNMMRGSCSSSISSSVSRCQECGNQAKRDCEYMRCRTCCKSRGFDCPTHVKSTWIPLSLRRPRQYYFQQHHQQQPPPPPPPTHHHHHHHPPPHHHHHHQLLPNSKRYKPFNLSSSSSSAGLQRRDFPGEVKTTATFRCVKMMSGDNVFDQCAYQTVVDIGGHVFKGLLYDQGPIHTDNEDDDEDEDEDEDDEDQDHDGCYNSGDHVHDHYHHSSMQQQHQQQQHQTNLNMSTAPATTAPTSCDAVTSSSYPSPFYPFMPAGMLYFPYPKS